MSRCLKFKDGLSKITMAEIEKTRVGNPNPESAQFLDPFRTENPQSAISIADSEC